MQVPVCGASILIVVGQGTPDDPDAELRRAIVDGDQLVATVARAVNTLPVAQGVVERVNLPEGYARTILKKTDVGTEPGTTFVEVSYKDTDAERAHRIANAIGETFSDQVSELNVSATPRNRSGVAGGDVARNPSVSRAPARRRAGAGDRDCARYRAGLPARVPGLRRAPRRKS
jgi:capsular polysaccharide biosynthesis protein